MADMELVNALSEVMGQVVERIIDEKVGKRLDKIEERLDRLEERFDELEKRLDRLENDVQFNIEFDALKDVVQKHSLQIKELQELAGISVN